MAVGEELGVGYVTLTVSTKGLGKDIAKQFRDAEKQAGRSGRRMGKEVSDEFNDAVDLSELERKVAIAEAKATKAIEDAARDQAKAKERVAVAEAKAAAAAERNAEAQEKAGDKSARAVSKVALEQRKLAAARLKAENAAKDQEAAEKRLQVVLEESGEDSEDAVKATRELDRAREKAADTSVQAAAAEDRLTNAKKAAVDADKAAAAAARAASDARDDLARNVDEAKRAYESASLAARLAADSESKLQRELRESKRAYKEAADAAERGGREAEENYRDGWKGLAKHLGRQVRDAVDKALDSVSVVGQGIAHGVAYAESFKAGMKSVHIGNPASGVSALAGGRGLGDMGRGFKDMVVNMDRAIPKISLVAAGLASLSGAAIAGVGGLVGIAAGLGSIAAVGLVLPGTLAGIVAGASVLAMAFADVTEVLKDLGPRFVELQDVVSANFWEVAAQPIRDLANKVLPVLVTGLGAVSTEFGIMARAIANTLGTDENIGFLTQQIEYLREAVDIAGEGAVYFTDALMKLGTVGASYLPNLASWLTIVGENFDTWVEKSMASGEIFGWIDTGIENLKALGWIVVSTVGIFHALGEAAANAGSGGLIGLADGMRAVNEAMHGDVFQGAMTNVFIGAGIGMQHIGDGLSALGDAFVNLAPTIAGVLGLAGDAIGTLIEGISTAIQQPIFKQGLLDFFLGIKRGADELQPAMAPLGDLFGTLGSLAGVMAENFGKVLGVAIIELGPVFTTLLDAVQPLIPILGDALVWAIQTVAPFLRSLTETIGGFVRDNPAAAATFAVLAGAFGLIIGAVIKVTPFLLTVGKLVGDVVGKFGGMSKTLGFASKAFRVLGGPIAWIITGLGLLVGAVVHAWNTNEEFRTAVMDLGAALGDMFRVIGELLMPVLGFLANAVGVVLVGAFEFLTPFLTMFAKLITWAAQAVTNKLTAAMIGFRDYVVPAFRAAIQWLGDKFRWLYDSVVLPVWDWIKNKIQAGWLNIQATFEALKRGLQWVGDKFRAIGNWIASIWNWLANRLRSLWSWIDANVFVPLKNGLQWVGNKFRDIGNWIASIWRWLADRLRAGYSWINSYVFTPIKNGIHWVGDKFRSIGNWIGRIWSWLGDTLRKGWTWINDYVFSPFKTGLGWLQDAFNNTKDGIKTAWDKLKAAVKDPVSFVVNSVVNPFITGYNKINDFWQGADLGKIEGFARGGVLPGYQRRKRDDVLTPMRSGEGVLVPEAVRGIGASTIHALNNAGNTGGESAVRRVWESGRFARGPEIGGHEKEAHAGPPGGPSGGLWGAIQTAMNRSGRLYVPNKSVRGGNVAEAAKAWMGQSALDIVVGSGSPGVNPRVGHRGPWGFADTSGNLEISTSTPGNRVMGTMIHELGHILSLGHPPGGYGARGSVMSAGMAGGDWPHAIDYSVLRRVWGNPGDGVTRYSASDVEGVTAASIDPIAWIADKLDKYITGPMNKARGMFANNKFSEMPLGIAGKLFDGVKGKAAELAAPFLGVIEDGKKVVSGAVSQVKVRSWMNKALSKKGLLNPGNMASGVARAMKESGGDPNIIQQIKDQNSGGNEARGLMQVIPPTFRQYQEPGYGNILDPVHNILASINYTLARYGSLRAGWDLPGGYAMGGIVDHVWDDPVGTVQALKPGVSTIYNGTGRTEHFERVSVGDSGSSRSSENHLHLHGQQYDSEFLVRRGAEQMAREFRKAGVG